jgi:hypothetical protein
MGLVDEDRQRRPSYQVWEELSRPARLAVVWTRDEASRPTGFKATVGRRPATEMPSYDLRGYRVEWKALDHEGRLLAAGSKDLPVIGSPAAVEASWPASPSREVRLNVRVLRLTGFVAAEREERWWEPLSGGLSPDEAKKRGLTAPER